MSENSLQTMSSPIESILTPPAQTESHARELWANHGSTIPPEKFRATCLDALEYLNSSLIFRRINPFFWRLNGTEYAAEIIHFHLKLYISGILAQNCTPDGDLPEKYVADYKDSYNRAANRLIREFSNRFCTEDGRIDWAKLVEFNSGD